MPERTLLFALSFATSVTNAEPVSFDADVLPILNQYCVMCHLPGAEQADLLLYPDAWSELVGIPSSQSSLSRVEPGSPEDSYMYLKLIGKQEKVDGSGLQMPVGQNPLNATQIEAIRKWIEQGAKKN